MSLTKLKTVARNKAKAMRSVTHQRIGFEASHKVSNHIGDFLYKRDHLKVVALYMAIKSEIDILPAAFKLRKLRKTLCLPAIISEHEPLKFMIWNESSRLVKGKFSVLVPETHKSIEPDLILCPMLSFDTRGYRLGYGGGFYDRTIDYLTSKKRILTLGCAYSEQISSELLPIGKYDKPLDAVVTETGVTFFNS